MRPGAAAHGFPDVYRSRLKPGELPRLTNGRSSLPRKHAPRGSRHASFTLYLPFAMQLRTLCGNLAVCRLNPHDPIPGWTQGAFTSITRTPEELSIVCGAHAVPAGIRAESGYRALAVQGPLDFALTGILASLAQPLAAANISIFAISTFDTDIILVREENYASAVQALTAAGHRVD